MYCQVIVESDKWRKIIFSGWTDNFILQKKIFFITHEASCFKAYCDRHQYSYLNFLLISIYIAYLLVSI